MVDLTGLRVLVVEDDVVIALLIEDILDEAGCFAVGPYVTLDEATEAAKTGDFKVAVLDVNLGGRLSYPLCEILEQRGIPFVLTSGYGDSAAPPNHPEWPICGKPFTSEALLAVLSELTSEKSKTGGSGFAEPRPG